MKIVTNKKHQYVIYYINKLVESSICDCKNKSIVRLSIKNKRDRVCNKNPRLDILFCCRLKVNKYNDLYNYLLTNKIDKNMNPRSICKYYNVDYL